MDYRLDNKAQIDALYPTRIEDKLSYVAQALKLISGELD